MRGRRRRAPPPLRRHCVARCPRRRLRRRAVRGPPAQRPRPPRARPPSPQALAVLTAAARGGRPRLPPQHGAQPRLRKCVFEAAALPSPSASGPARGQTPTASCGFALAATRLSLPRGRAPPPSASSGRSSRPSRSPRGGSSSRSRSRTPPSSLRSTAARRPMPGRLRSSRRGRSPSRRAHQGADAHGFDVGPLVAVDALLGDADLQTVAAFGPASRGHFRSVLAAGKPRLLHTPPGDFTLPGASSARPTTSTSTPSRRPAGSSRSLPRRSSTGTAAAASRRCSASSRPLKHPTPSRRARLCLPLRAPLRRAPRGHVRDARLRPHRTAPRAQPAARHARRRQPPPCLRRRLRDPPGPAIPEPAHLTTLALDLRLSRALDGGAHVLRVVRTVAASTPPDQAHTVVGLVRRVLPLFTRSTRPRSPSTRPPSSSGRSTATARPTSPPRSSSRPSTASLPTAPRSTRTPPPSASSSGPSGRRPRTARTSLPPRRTASRSARLRRRSRARSSPTSSASRAASAPRRPRSSTSASRLPRVTSRRSSPRGGARQRRPPRRRDKGRRRRPAGLPRARHRAPL